jgi:hypothetical protein
MITNRVRLDSSPAGGWWSHKPGQTPVRNVDNNNNVLLSFFPLWCWPIRWVVDECAVVDISIENQRSIQTRFLSMVSILWLYDQCSIPSSYWINVNPFCNMIDQQLHSLASIIILLCPMANEHLYMCYLTICILIH